MNHILRCIALLGSFSSIMPLASLPATAQVSAPQLWKARALEAAEKLETLRSKVLSLQDRWHSQEANETKCEAMLESAFLLHLTHESSAHKVLENGKHGFKIILNGGDQGLFDLTYFYDPKTWSLTSARVLLLPQAWELVLPSGELRGMGGIMLIIQGKEAKRLTCTMGFSLTEPFWAHVVRSKMQGKTQKPR